MDVNRSVRLRKWAIEEVITTSTQVLNAVLIPSSDALENVCRGRNNEIWTYLTDHVRSRATVLKIKSKLQIYNTMKNKKPTKYDCDTSSRDKARLIRSLSTVLSKKSYLENMISEFENKICCADSKLKDLRDNSVKSREMCSLLRMCDDFFKEKSTFVKLLSNELKMRIRKVKFDTNARVFGKSHSELCLPRAIALKTRDQYCSLLQAKESSFIIKSSDQKQLFDAETAVNLIEDLFREISKKNITDLHQCKKDLWLKVEEMFSAYFASDIMSNLQKQGEKSIKFLQSTRPVSENMTKSCLSTSQSVIAQPPKKDSTVAIELQKQVVIHIHSFLAKENCLNANSSLLDRNTVALKLLFSQLSHSGITENEAELHNSFLETEVQAHSTYFSLQYLKQLTQALEKEMQILQKQNDNDLSECYSLHDLQQRIDKNRRAMCEFLKQNTKTHLNCERKHRNLKTMATTLVNLDKIELERSVIQLKQSLQFEDSMVYSFSKTGYFFFRPVINLCSIGNFPVLLRLLDVLGIKPFENNDVALERCIDLKNLINMGKETTLDQIKVLQNLEMEKPSLHISENKNISYKIDIFRQLNSVVDVGNNFIVNGETSYIDIQEALYCWWEQPAQFIPNVVVANKSLREWIKLLTILK